MADRIGTSGDIVIRNSNGHRLRIVEARPIGNITVCYTVMDLDDEQGRDDTFLIDRSKVRGPLMSDEERQDRKSQSAGKD